MDLSQTLDCMKEVIESPLFGRDSIGRIPIPLHDLDTNLATQRRAIGGPLFGRRGATQRSRTRRRGTTLGGDGVVSVFHESFFAPEVARPLTFAEYIAAMPWSHTKATCGTRELPTAVSWFRAIPPGSPLTTG